MTTMPAKKRWILMSEDDMWTSDPWCRELFVAVYKITRRIPSMETWWCIKRFWWVVVECHTMAWWNGCCRQHWWWELHRSKAMVQQWGMDGSRTTVQQMGLDGMDRKALRRHSGRGVVGDAAVSWPATRLPRIFNWSTTYQILRWLVSNHWQGH